MALTPQQTIAWTLAHDLLRAHRRNDRTGIARALGNAMNAIDRLPRQTRPPTGSQTGPRQTRPPDPDHRGR